MGAHGREDRCEHRGRQDTGVGVVTRAMIAREQPELSDIRCGTMRKGNRRAALAQRHHGTVVRDSTKRHDRRKPWHFSNDRAEKLAAGVDLGWYRLVLWRHATHCIGDAGSDQFKSVVRICRLVSATENELR